MARYRESNCVGCERCFNCGAKEGYLVYECDECGDEYTDPEEIITEGNRDFCKSCYNKIHGNQIDIEDYQELGGSWGIKNEV